MTWTAPDAKPSPIYLIVRAAKRRHDSGRSGTWRVRPAHIRGEALWALWHRNRRMLTWAESGYIHWIRPGPYRRDEVIALNNSLWALDAAYMVTKRCGRHRPVFAMIDWMKHPEETW